VSGPSVCLRNTATGRCNPILREHTGLHAQMDKVFDVCHRNFYLNPPSSPCISMATWISIAEKSGMFQRLKEGGTAFFYWSLKPGLQEFRPNISWKAQMLILSPARSNVRGHKHKVLSHFLMFRKPLRRQGNTLCNSYLELQELYQRFNKKFPGQFSKWHTVEHLGQIRHCATRRKVAGSNPDGVTGFFIDLTLLAALCPGIQSSRNRCEHQEYLTGGKGGRCVGLRTLPPLHADCLELLGALTSWNPTHLSRTVYV
jgi:hypothetical protein